MFVATPGCAGQGRAIWLDSTSRLATLYTWQWHAACPANLCAASASMPCRASSLRRLPTHSEEKQHRTSMRAALHAGPAWSMRCCCSCCCCRRLCCRGWRGPSAWQQAALAAADYCRHNSFCAGIPHLLRHQPDLAGSCSAGRFWTSERRRRLRRSSSDGHRSSTGRGRAAAPAPASTIGVPQAQGSWTGGSRRPQMESGGLRLTSRAAGGRSTLGLAGQGGRAAGPARPRLPATAAVGAIGQGARTAAG